MSLDSPIKVYESLNDVYVDDSLSTQRSRWLSAASTFEKTFSRPVESIARAPGRINLIGEHVDYCLFGVIPAAVEMDTLILFSGAGDSEKGADGDRFTLNLANTDARWPASEFVYERKGGDGWKLVQGGDKGVKTGWVDYVRASMETLLDRYFSSSSRLPRSLNLLISGNVPAGSGLSSSAALIVASLVAILAGNGIISASPSDSAAASTNGCATASPPTAAEVVQLARDSEARLGVNTGGMDQAISVLAQRGTGTYVTFWPKLGVESVSLGEDLAMVISNSLATHNLAADAKRHYNLRVVETLAAARLIAVSLGLDVVPDAKSGEKFTLREVAEVYGRQLFNLSSDEMLDSEQLEKTLTSLLGELDTVFDAKNEGHILEEIISASKLDDGDFKRIHLHLEVLLDEQDGKFRLLKRARHVYAEALRVLHFRRTCGTSSEESIEKKSDVLGKLMDDSHASCRDDYECSSEELEELVAVCKSAGAIGSRLSGAGWGGCVVSLIERSKQVTFIEEVKEKYTKYSSEKDLSQVIFPSVPGSGAGLCSAKILS